MMLLALKSLHALEERENRLGGHAGRKHQLLGPQGDLLAAAIEDDSPFLFRRIEARLLGGRLGPVIQLHHLGVHFQPIADLVLGREHRPVLGEIDVGQAPASGRRWQQLWSPALLIPRSSDRDETSRPGLGSCRSRTRAGAKTSLAVSANKAIAICAACSRR